MQQGKEPSALKAADFYSMNAGKAVLEAGVGLGDVAQIVARLIF
jgi:hypothetical protein